MDRPAKLQRLNEFRRSKGYCSAAVMSQILDDIKRNGAPDLSGRRDMRQARDRVTKVDTVYGPMLHYLTCIDIDGSPVQIPVGDPLATLASALKSSEPFRKLFRASLESHPSTFESPWTIVIYSDEVTPGNALSPMNHRKFHAIYWTFLELGTTALSHDEAWFTLLTEYSSTVNNLDSGLSQLFGQALKLFQKAPRDVKSQGITLEFDNDEVIRFFAHVGVVLQDGGAHKSVWMSRGDSGS